MEEQIPKLAITALSASRIKTYEGCSWKYYCQYILKIPRKQNEGAAKGSVCHDIFELLILPKHKKKYNDIILQKSIHGSVSIKRLVKLYIKKYNLPLTEEVFNLIDKMIVVGLTNDFYIKGAKLVSPEYEFKILNQNPTYLITGKIDKPSIKGKKIFIDDYKGSKLKFSGEDEESNLQAMIYSLATKKIWPELEPEVRFIFLQFEKDPIIKMSFTEQQLKGLEYYLEDIQKRLDSFSEKDAISNMASTKGFPKDKSFSGVLLCGFSKHENDNIKKDGTPKFSCEFKWKRKYYVVKKGNKMIKSYMDKNNIKLKDGETLEEMEYIGCPAYRNILNTLPINKTKYIDTSKILDNF